LPTVIHSRSYTISIGVISGGTFPTKILLLGCYA